MNTSINFFGVNISTFTLKEALERVNWLIQNGQKAIISYVHISGLNIAYECTWFRSFLNNSDFVYCDGMGVKLGARLMGHALPERFTLADWMNDLVELSQKKGYSLFFLGNPPGEAELAAKKLFLQFPEIKIVGTHHGYFNKGTTHPENLEVIREINSSSPDILLVGFGMPAQEKWLLENWPDLQVNIAITVGGAFEYISGNLKRGPAWMTNHYLEWLARIFISPQRYTRRYLKDVPLFLLRLYYQRNHPSRN